MKSRPFVFGRCLLPAVALVSFSGSAMAGVDTVHTNTTGNFESTASWAGGVAPTSVNFAVFNNVSTAGKTAMTYNSSSYLTLGGFKIVDPATPVVSTIANGRTFNFGGLTTTGTSGIDMPAAT